ncbi:MAG: RNA polymerase sigma factor [Anaerolineales bacterium]|nr:RNA polymerase sigma factor [Anaerolineales bacterium]
MPRSNYSSRCSAADFTQWVEAYQAPVFNLCFRLLGAAAEAEDAAQETFLRAYTHRDRYDPHRPAKTWLMSIAAHYCIDRLRRRHLVWVSLEAPQAARHPALRQPGLGPEALLLQAERWSELQGHLKRLAPLDQQVLVLHYWGGLSYGDIAAATGLTISAVKSRLHRARARLAALLRQPIRLTRAAARPAAPLRSLIPG